ncbi:MAG: hypothetical protein K2P94_13350 [Rhodospirillaceae bacterium]|nr:hypothetical protein [Rhodospirillaceae bacterium]
MTELVTSFAASQQLNLLAPRQQVFVVDRQGEDSSFSAADIAAAQVDTPEDTTSQSESSFDDQNPVNRHQDETPKSARDTAPPPSGPSKARVEIKHIDLGLTPSEVVGTPDILQRFDANGDGRVDLIEAARAGVAREGVFTFAGLATVSQKSEEQAQAQVIAEAQAVAQPQVAVAPDASPAPVTVAVNGKKLFTAAEAGAGAAKKFFHAVAAQGTPTGTVDAPKKFYGQGAEVVVGKFAAAEQTPKFAAKVSADEKIVVTEDGGETKLYDKVAQTDTDQAGDDTAPGERPKTAPAEDAPVAKKPVRVAVAAYTSDTASTTTVVTA